jgi:hypothetical protein
MSTTDDTRRDAFDDASLLTPLGLSAATVAALRSALVDRARGVPPEEPDALRDALRRAGEEARARGVTAERLLIDFKLLWYSLPEVRAQRQGQQSDLLAGLVTACIQEYYRTG